MIKTNAIQLTEELLKGSGLSSFNFATSFTLTFDRENVESGPWCVALRLDCDWWFGERSLWDLRVAELDPPDLPEPEEAVQAFDLVRLRWSSGSKIEHVKLNGTGLQLTFSNGMTFSAKAREVGESWELVEPGMAVEESVYAVVANHEEVFAKRPLT